MAQEIGAEKPVVLVAPIPMKVNGEVKVVQTPEILADIQEEMYGDIRVLNMGRAKSLLKKELFEWIETSELLKKMAITTVQVAFTKCGRFAVQVERSKFGHLGLRLAVLDPHHRLSTYLLGVSMTLESALLHSAARIKQIEDDVDEIDRTFKHGDVIHVEHLGYSHVAVYDAERQLFYELVGDIDSGKDALLAQVNNAHSAALQLHEDLKRATHTRLKAALSVFRNASVSSACPFQSTSTESIVTSISTNLAASTQTSLTSTATHTTTTTIDTLLGTTTDSTSNETRESFSSTSATPESTSLSESSFSSSTTSVPPTPQLFISTTTTKSVARSHLNLGLGVQHDTTLISELDVSSTSRIPTILSSSTSALTDSPTQASKRLPRSYSYTGLSVPSADLHQSFQDQLSLDTNGTSRRTREDLQRITDEEKRRQMRASVLTHSGLLFDVEPQFYGEEEAYQPESMEQRPEGSKYDAKMHLLNATRNLRQLATSWDDIGLNALLKEDETNYVTAAERDASIQPDDMCPAMAIGFASHSIAEVQATPKDIFLTRDPLLRKTVKFYANALPPAVVVARARMALGSPGWNPVTRNCEHFATWAKTGRTVSTQVFEIGSNTAIFGASTLQLVVTLAFIGLTLAWFLGRFTSGSTLIESIEACLSWGLKYGVAFSSVIFAVGLLIHWQNGTSADFDSWVLQHSAAGQVLPSSPPTPSPSLDSDPQASQPTSPHASRPSTPPISALSSSDPSPIRPPTFLSPSSTTSFLPPASLRNSIPRRRDVTEK